MDSFLNKEDRVSDLPLGDEAPLVFRDEVVEVGLEAHGKDFSDEFVGGIAKRDGPKYREGGGEIFFGDKGKEGRVGVAPNFLLPLSPLYHFD